MICVCIFWFIWPQRRFLILWTRQRRFLSETQLFKIIGGGGQVYKVWLFSLWREKQMKCIQVKWWASKLHQLTLAWWSSPFTFISTQRSFLWLNLPFVFIFNQKCMITLSQGVLEKRWKTHKKNPWGFGWSTWCDEVMKINAIWMLQ